MTYGNEIPPEQLYEAISDKQFDPLPNVHSGTELEREVRLAAMSLRRVPSDSALVVRNPETGERVTDFLTLTGLARPAIHHAMEALGVPYILPDGKA